MSCHHLVDSILILVNTLQGKSEELVHDGFQLGAVKHLFADRFKNLLVSGASLVSHSWALVVL